MKLDCSPIGRPGGNHVENARGPAIPVHRREIIPVQIRRFNQKSRNGANTSTSLRITQNEADSERRAESPSPSSNRAQFRPGNPGSLGRRGQISKITRVAVQRHPERPPCSDGDRTRFGNESWNPSCSARQSGPCCRHGPSRQRQIGSANSATNCREASCGHPRQCCGRDQCPIRRP